MKYLVIAFVLGFLGVLANIMPVDGLEISFMKTCLTVGLPTLGLLVAMLGVFDILDIGESNDENSENLEKEE